MRLVSREHYPKLLEFTAYLVKQHLLEQTPTASHTLAQAMRLHLVMKAARNAVLSSQRLKDSQHLELTIIRPQQ